MTLALGLALALAAAPAEQPAHPSKLYTTYFYTAGEAVVHGDAPEARVRIVSLQVEIQKR